MSLDLAARQLALDLPVASAARLEDFLPAPCNQAAYEAVTSWPDWPATALLIDGPAGSGKSHLARIWAERSGALSLEPAQIWRTLDPLAWLDRHRTCVVESADLVDDEVLLLQIYNLLAERKGHLLMTARRPLAAWRCRLPDLASRLRTAWTVSIAPPDDTLLAALLVKQFQDRQLTIAPGVLDYLVRHMERSFATARALVEELDRASLRAKRPVTMPLARNVLAIVDAVSGS